jgi:hypothetical protein
MFSFSYYQVRHEKLLANKSPLPPGEGQGEGMQIIGLKRVLFLTPSSAAQGCANAAMAGMPLSGLSSFLLGACAEGRRDFLSTYPQTGGLRVDLNPRVHRCVLMGTPVSRVGR